MDRQVLLREKETLLEQLKEVGKKNKECSSLYVHEDDLLKGEKSKRKRIIKRATGFAICSALTFMLPGILPGILFSIGGLCFLVPLVREVREYKTLMKEIRTKYGSVQALGDAVKQTQERRYRLREELILLEQRMEVIDFALSEEQEFDSFDELLVKSKGIRAEWKHLARGITSDREKEEAFTFVKSQRRH